MATAASTLSDITSSQSVTQQSESYARLIHAAAVNGDKATLQKILKDPYNVLEEVDQFGRTPLMLTVLADHIECAQVLLKNGANVDAKDGRGRTALHWAAYKGIFRFCGLLISRGAYWREKDREGLTALHLATKHENTRCLSLILKELFVGEVDEQDANKRTALHWSASYGNLETVRILIAEGSNIGIPDVDGKTPLHWAATAGDSETATATVQLILESEPSVINWQDYEGRTALHLAVADGNTKTVETLINFQTHLEKCNISVLDNMFRTPLHWSAVLGHTHIVNLLLDKKASFSSSDGNGATALHYAAQNNHAETVEAFLSREDITDEPDLERRTALMWAAGKGADDVIHIMMNHQGDINATDKIGATALHAAAMAGHTSTVGVLLKFGADVNVRDENKHTPLFRAAEMGQTETLNSLIDGGASVDVLDDEGRSPLHWAARGGHSLVCSNLLRHKISPNVQDHHGRTPLQCAAYGGFINCMKILLMEGADPDLQDKEGVTALHYACSTGYLEAVRLLLEHGSFINHMEVNEDCFTPLDHALLNGHHDVVQFMIEQGALSINTIRDLAASRIQAIFRGYCVRKTFLERKLLLVKHDELRKHAALRKREFESEQNEGGSVHRRKENDIIPLEDEEQDTEKECDTENRMCESTGEEEIKEVECKVLVVKNMTDEDASSEARGNMDRGKDETDQQSSSRTLEKPQEGDEMLHEKIKKMELENGKDEKTNIKYVEHGKNELKEGEDDLENEKNERTELGNGEDEKNELKSGKNEKLELRNGKNEENKMKYGENGKNESKNAENEDSEMQNEKSGLENNKSGLENVESNFKRGQTELENGEDKTDISAEDCAELGGVNELQNVTDCLKMINEEDQKETESELVESTSEDPVLVKELEKETVRDEGNKEKNGVCKMEKKDTTVNEMADSIREEQQQSPKTDSKDDKNSSEVRKTINSKAGGLKRSNSRGLAERVEETSLENEKDWNYSKGGRSKNIGKEKTKKERESQERTYKISLNVNSVNPLKDLKRTETGESRKMKQRDNNKDKSDVRRPKMRGLKEEEGYEKPSDQSKGEMQGRREQHTLLEKRRSLSRYRRQKEVHAPKRDSVNSQQMRRARTNSKDVEIKTALNNKAKPRKANAAVGKHGSIKTIPQDKQTKANATDRGLPSIYNNTASIGCIQSAQQRHPGRTPPSRERLSSWPSSSLHSEFDWRGCNLKHSRDRKESMPSDEKQRLKHSGPGQVRRQRAASAVTMGTGYQDTKFAAFNQPFRRQKLHPVRVRSASNEKTTENGSSPESLSNLPVPSTEEKPPKKIDV